jgi:general secretion pathway protein M
MMRSWWSERTSSERRVLALGGLVLMGAVYFLFLIEPLHDACQRSAVRLQAERELAAHLATVAAEAAALGGARALPWGLSPGASLLAVVTETARASGVQARTRRMTPVGARALSLFVEDIPFGQLAGWLASLESTHGILAESLSLEAGAHAGLVDAELTLAASP